MSAAGKSLVSRLSSLVSPSLSPPSLPSPPLSLPLSPLFSLFYLYLASI